MNNITKITAPSLNSANFGSAIADVMDNINKNFEIIGNHDFIKGEQGDSIIIQKVDLTSEENVSILTGIKQAIIDKAYNENNYNPRPIDGVSWDAWFDKNDNSTYPGSITLIYKTTSYRGNITATPVSSLPYIYKDLRFNNINLSDEKNIGEIDLSSVIYYSPVDGREGEFGPEDFQILDVFPKVYYDHTIGDFAWNINNARTGLRARGPEGPSGKNGEYNVVIAGNKQTGDMCEITHVFNNGSLIDLKGEEDWRGIFSSLDINNNDTVFAVYNTNSSESNKLYVGKIYFPSADDQESSLPLVYCSSENLIQAVNAISNTTIETMCNDILGKSDE